MSDDFDFDPGNPRRRPVKQEQPIRRRRRNNYQDEFSDFGGNRNVPIINIGNGNGNGNATKVLFGLVVVLFLIIIGMVIFGRGDNTNNSFQIEIERLTKIEQEQNQKIDSLNLLIPEYKQKDLEWERKDSISGYNLNIQKRKTNEYRIKSDEARKNRIEAEKKLKDFESNPPFIEGLKLLFDTEKRINNGK